MENMRGQNVVEYLLLVTAVLLVCIYFFTGQAGTSLSNGVNASINSMVNQVSNLNSLIQLQ